MAAETTQALAALAAEIRASGLTRPEVEGLLYQLSPGERRLFLRLCRGPADTAELRTACSVGNVSEAATRTNAKLAAAGDPRRIVCDVRPHDNRYGERGVLGHWRITRGVHERAAA